MSHLSKKKFGRFVFDKSVESIDFIALLAFYRK